MRLAEMFEAKKFIVCAQLRPPRGAGAALLAETAGRLRNAVDAVTIADNGGARLAMSPLAAAALLSGGGLEVIATLSCRDRNRLALEADILGAAALGIGNLLLVSGEHPRLGDHASALPVYDLDSVQLLQAARSLAEGRDLAGGLVNPAPKLLLGAAANPSARPLEPHLLKLEKKVRAGASFVITQPVFDLKRYADFARRARELGLKVLAGVRVLCTADIERFEARRLPGVHIPPELIERVRFGGNGGLDEGVAIAAEVVKSLHTLKAADGVHFTGVAGREHLLPVVLKQAAI